MKLGIFKNGKEVRISKNSLNRHITVFGMPGSGKTVRNDEIKVDAAKQGKTVIEVYFERELPNTDSNMVNVIDVVKDGVNMKLLDTRSIVDKKETEVTFVSYLIDLLSGQETLGCRQTGALREAILYALKNRYNYKTDLQAIKDGLENQESAGAKGAYNKLWALLCSDVFRETGKSIKPGYINVFVLGNLAPSAQTTMTELLLGTIWRQARLNGRCSSEILIVLDEVQRLKTNKNSVIAEMLRESRQYNISLLLSTQSAEALNKDFLKAIHESAIALYFRPKDSEAKKIAELIDPQQVERYTLMLKKLQKGQSIVTGQVTIGGCENDKPIIIKSEYGSNRAPILNPQQVLTDKKSV